MHLEQYLLGLRVAQTEEAHDLTLRYKDLGDLYRAGDDPIAGHGAFQHDGVLRRMDPDVIARRDLLEPLPQEVEVCLDEEIEEHSLCWIEHDERRDTDRLAVDEDLIRGDDEHISNGGVGHRDPREGLLEVEHLRFADRDVQANQAGVGRERGGLGAGQTEEADQHAEEMPGSSMIPS